MSEIKKGSKVTVKLSEVDHAFAFTSEVYKSTTKNKKEVDESTVFEVLFLKELDKQPCAYLKRVDDKDSIPMRQFARVRFLKSVD